MTPEARFTAWFAKYLPTGWHYQRIETTIGRGVPDANVCAAGQDFWVEFKAQGRMPGYPA
jgi:hypothetical protein